MARFHLLSAAAVLLAGSCAHAQNPQSPPAPGAAPAAAAGSPAGKPGAAPAPSLSTAPAQKITWTDAHVDGPYIAMTFDDGPSGANTPKLLDLLARKHIKATFFLVGQCAAEFPQLVKRELAEGHEVANHSWSHPNLAKMSEEGVRSELQKTQDAIREATGFTPKIMRPPYGELTGKQRQWVHGDFGFKVILWDVDPLDWKDRNAATVARRIIAGTRPGSIILSHDIHATTVAAMPEVFDTLLAKGFKFVTVSELLAMDKGTARPEPVKPKASDAAARKAGAASSPSATPAPVSAAATPSAPAPSAVPDRK